MAIKLLLVSDHPKGYRYETEVHLPVIYCGFHSKLILSGLNRFRCYHKKVKLKFSRYRPSVAQRVGRGLALLFHDRGNRRG